MTKNKGRVKRIGFVVQEWSEKSTLSDAPRGSVAKCLLESEVVLASANLSIEAAVDTCV
ncbi:MAG: hypothetical protein NTY15_18005 [Planctomycetota bacterium]|nr:hypothetical protein [Planctomycetota bacterium]